MASERIYAVDRIQHRTAVLVDEDGHYVLVPCSRLPRELKESDVLRVPVDVPDGASVAAGDSVTVYTGSGRGDGRSFYWDSRTPRWDDDGDAAILRDRTWDIVANYSY